MSTAVQLRRGTTSQHSSFTGAVGEVTVDTDKDTVVVHDGSTAGGFPALNGKDKGVTVAEQTSATGSLKLPTGTTAERDGSPVTGATRFNSTLGKAEIYNGTAWGSVGGGATGGGADAVFVENDKTVTANYTITSNKNAMSTGPLTINSGVTVTVPTGSVWVIL
jgi:hypothetical protein